MDKYEFKITPLSYEYAKFYGRWDSSQLAFGAVCKGVHFDGLMNRWHRGTMCSQGTVCAQVGSTELQSRTLL